MKILYIAQYFPPELNGGATRVYELSSIWAAQGHEVTVTTCVPCHPTGIVPESHRGKERSEETLDGFRVRWTPVFTTPNTGFGRRILNHLSFMFWAFVRNAKLAQNYDVIIATSPPLFVGIAGYLLRLYSGRPFVFEVRDLWPKQAVDLGALKNKYLIYAIEKLEMFLYRRARHVVCVTTDTRDILMKRGIDASKISIVSNGVDLKAFENVLPERELLQDLQGKFIVSYIGTQGMSQGLGHVLDAAHLLKETEDIHFLFIGDGADKAELMAKKDQLELENVTFLDTQPREKVAGLYAASDVCLVPLRNTELFHHTIPSKIFEIMACGKPILLGVKGEAQKILEQAGAGIAYEPESAKALAEAVDGFYRSPEKLTTFGLQGADFVALHYNRTSLANKYLQDVLLPIRGETP